MLKNPLTSKSSKKYLSQHSSKSPSTSSQTPKKEKRKHTHTHTHTHTQLFTFHTICSKAPGTWIPRSTGLQTFKLRKKCQWSAQYQAALQAHTNLGKQILKLFATELQYNETLFFSSSSRIYLTHTHTHIIEKQYWIKKKGCTIFFNFFFFGLRNYFDMCFDNLIKFYMSFLYNTSHMLSNYLSLYKHVLNVMDIYFQT
jgi:hypothetical protein